MRRALVLFCLVMSASARAAVLTGIDALEREDFAALAGKRVGLITNQTGVDSRGRSTVDALFESKRLTLTAIFSPEHGFRGTEGGGEPVGDTKDPATGLPVYSLYGKTLRPTAKMLEGIDVLVFDIQDVGARFYTYLATMGYCMEEASKRGIEFVVLDRPNPLGGAVLEGPVSKGGGGPTKFFAVPVRHGMTAGEMARFYAGTKKLQLNLSVIGLQGWDRSALYDETGLAWIRPSPNIPDVDAALLYPGLGCFEAANVSVGRGTDSPFLWFGAPWLDAQGMVETLRKAGLAGVRFTVEDKTPGESPYKGRFCRGVGIQIVDKKRVRPLDILVTAAAAMRGLAVSALEDAPSFGNNVFKDVLDSKETPAKILADFAKSWKAFDGARRKYLLY